MKSKLYNALAHVGEWLLVVAFLIASVSELTYAEPVVEGFIGILFSGPVTTVIYAVWFTLMAIGLAWSKIRKRKKLHKHSLMAMYLTTFYTISLSLAIGPPINVVDDIVIGVIAAACWMRWKFRTEYISPHQFDDDIWELRNDTPNH